MREDLDTHPLPGGLDPPGDKVFAQRLVAVQKMEFSIGRSAPIGQIIRLALA
jgi:hypothetical protein